MTGPKRFWRKFANLFHLFLFVLGILILVIVPFIHFANPDWDVAVSNMVTNISAALLTVALIFLLQRLLYVDENETFRGEVLQRLEGAEAPLQTLGKMLDARIGAEQVLPPGPPMAYRYKLRGRRHRQIIGVISADIRDVTDIDVWVNSENTNMQMSRFYENTISGIIRYLGARKDAQNQAILDDTVNNELRELVGGQRDVPAHSVLVTGSGELAKTHGVKKIFHVAAVQGQVTAGYAPVKDPGRCVTNALQKAAAEEYRDAGLHSILFPLLGTGHAGGAFGGEYGWTLDRLLSVFPFYSNIQYG